MHTSMHLTYNMASFISKHIHTYPKVKENQTHKRKPSIYLVCENPIIHLKQGSKHIIKHNTYHKPSINTLETLIIHLSVFHHIIKIKPKHKCMDISNA